jgi:Holliday junction resolvase RusA-like endonuclease
MAVNNKQPIRPNRGRLRISIEVLKLREREVVVDPASRRDSDNLVAR